MDIGMPPSPIALTVTGPMVLVCILSVLLRCWAAADRNTGKSRGMPGGGQGMPGGAGALSGNDAARRAA
jgi:hypothetical protein